jgi:hypothetical protein
MDPKQKEVIVSDLPAKSLAVDAFENVWFLGTQYLWKWSPAKSKVQQIKLVTTLPLKHLKIDGEFVYVSDDEQLFRIEIEPFRVTSYPSSSKNSASLGITGEQNPIYWIKTDGIYELALEKGEMTRTLNHSLAEFENSKYLYISQTRTLWMLRSHELSYISYGSNKKSNKFGRIDKNIYDIQKSNDDIFAISKFAVFRFTKKGKLIQTVPVKSERRIVLSSLMPNAHAFVFQDRLLEVQVPLEKKTFHFYLDVGRIHKASMMSFRNSYLGLILDGNPRVFELNKTAWTS